MLYIFSFICWCNVGAAFYIFAFSKLFNALALLSLAPSSPPTNLYTQLDTNTFDTIYANGCVSVCAVCVLEKNNQEGRLKLRLSPLLLLFCIFISSCVLFSAYSTYGCTVCPWGLHTPQKVIIRPRTMAILPKRRI